MPEENKSLRVGDLLVKAGIIAPDVIEDRLEVSKVLGQPLGQTLEQTGDLTRYQLVSAIELQSLFLDSAISMDAAVQAIKLVVTENHFLEDALKKVGMVDSGSSSTRLGELLTDAAALSEEQLRESLDISFREGTPLGQVLTHKGWVSPSVIVKALSAQRLLRSGKTSREEAISELRAFQRGETPAKQGD